MTTKDVPPGRALTDMAMGYIRGKTLCAAVRLEIADALGDGEQHLDELAVATGSDRDALYRLLRALAGDQLLASFARLLESCLAPGDSAARLDGDEFTVLLPGADLERALRFAERIRRRIERLNLGVTASMGICPFDPANRSLQIVQKADQAMYMAKKNGGNGVCAFDPATNELTDVTERMRAGA